MGICWFVVMRSSGSLSVPPRVVNGTKYLDWLKSFADNWRGCQASV
ncbi:Uncharacterised protein [Bordetella pertussis]|nr:Uncharacterised protein [Bordetella pertussis]